MKHLAAVVLMLRCIGASRILTGGRQLCGHMQCLVDGLGDFEQGRLPLVMRRCGGRMCSCYEKRFMRMKSEMEEV